MTVTAPDALGAYLKGVRHALGLTLRDVETRTQRAITNGYLSQIEKGSIKQPSPNVLYQLAHVYDVSYSDLLRRAGHHVPENKRGSRLPGTRSHTSRRGTAQPVGGLPQRAMEELTADEEAELLEYLAFIRKRRANRAT